MAKTRLYLDICCFNRPFDEPLTPLVRLEAEAVSLIQQQISLGKVELAWSFIMEHENADNPYEDRKRAISAWRQRAVVDVEAEDDVFRRALLVVKCGIKSMDALHIACAIVARCRFFLTTDKKVLKKRIDGITLLNPMDYIQTAEDGP